MKTKTLLIVLSIIFILTGCSKKQKYVELDKEGFSALDISRVESVRIVSVPFGKENQPDEWKPKYTNVFPITDAEKIKTIYDCIKDSEDLIIRQIGKCCFRSIIRCII